MAKAKVIHSQSSVTVIFKGNKSNPEPPEGVIKFPGGHIAVSRCSDGTYWAHVSVHHETHKVIGSRIDYDLEKSREVGIPSIEDDERIEHVAIRIGGHSS